jgi:hypothetical protein
MDPMTDSTVSSPLSSFTSYRRKQALASIAEELQRRSWASMPAPTPSSDWAEPEAVAAGLHRLTASADPSVVFSHLAELLVPTLCDEAAAVVHVGAEAAAWRQHQPATADLTAIPAQRGESGWVLTVTTPAHTDFKSDSAGPHYVAVLTCRGRGQGPTGQEVALLQLAAHHAAAVVHQARQQQLLHRYQEQAGHLLAALDTNRTISAAVGVLMVTQRLTYQQAFELLQTTSQTTNTKLAVVAETVLSISSQTVDPLDEPRRGSGVTL